MLDKKNIVRAVMYMLAAIAAALGILFGVTSCSVNRTVTTVSECHQRGDTSVVITTKTVETYTGRKLDSL